VEIKANIYPYFYYPLIAPAPIHKLGHFGMCVTDYSSAYDFYTTRFNFFPSDVRPSLEIYQ